MRGGAPKATTDHTSSPATTENASSSTILVTSASLIHPIVKDISHTELVKWKQARRGYEDAVDAHCRVTCEDKAKTLRSVKKLFDSRLLEWLCKFEWGTSVETVTEDRIVQELDKMVGNVMNDAIIDVDSLFDIKVRVVKYFMKCDEISLQHGLQSTFSTLTGIKEKCKILKQYLEPTALRDAVDSHQRLVDSASQADE
ncbi:hypothetical protein PHPALM_30606 [Phytophthora palmivora]|uniref:Uncharacterized protein n=1 Tax=Phytophthora palmivora TaxID=4796 RepID=A0A2P4X4Q6_9STRA|nr:hypothetical protein PHPALM_30606 [Phytophthora palmivora]